MVIGSILGDVVGFNGLFSCWVLYDNVYFGKFLLFIFVEV